MPAMPAEASASGLLFPGAAEPAPPPSLPPLLLFPCVARRTGEGAPQWPLTDQLVAQWEETFPGMDVLGEARKAREWLLANHRKTYGGMRNFLLRWLCKAQNSGRFMRSARLGGRRADSGPEPRTLEEVYGFASWTEWEATLRKHFAGRELEQELAKLGEIRAGWEAKHG